MSPVRHLQTTIKRYPIAGEFKISRGSKTEAEVVICRIEDNGFVGLGECVPYKRYGETLDTVLEEISRIALSIEAGAGQEDLLTLLPPGAARNAVDCALWDLDAKKNGLSVAERIGLSQYSPLVTAYTISLDTVEKMAEQSSRYAHRALLKIKLGTDDDEARMRAIRNAAPNSTLIIDANEGWRIDNLERHMAIAEECGVALIEQPLPANHDEILASTARPVLVCADESVHHTGDLSTLRDRYDAVNIKLDKTGGLTEGLRMKTEAERLGFRIMVGCMVGSSLAMAPAVLLAQGADFVDLDGPLLLAQDHEPGLVYRDSLVFPPERAVWG